MTKFLSNLNPSQQQAVDYDGGHLLIIAGPGTGKTHTLTQRIAVTIPRLKNHQKILAVTFTQHAAKEMRERVTKLSELPRPLGVPSLNKEGGLSTVCIGTFHAFCVDVLRKHGGMIGLLSDFRIASESDMEQIVRECWPQASARERSDKLKAVVRFKSVCHPSESWEPVALKTTLGFHLSKTDGLRRNDIKEDDSLGKDVERFNQALRDKNFLDYDDLLLETVRLLQESPATQNILQKHYPYIFVDEYQDINPVQHQLLLGLVGKDSRITAIGDPDQSIYGFRGSDVELFHRFSRDFRGAKVLNLTDNYRSGGSLLKASYQVISQNADEARRELVAQFHGQGALTIHEAATEKAEAEYIVQKIEQMVGGTSLFSQDSRRVSADAKANRGFGDIAVLYRLNVQSHALKEALDRSGIPYAVTGDQSLIERKPVAEFLDAIEKLPKGEPSIPEKLQYLRNSVSWQKLFEKNPSWLNNVDQLIRVSRDFETVEALRDALALQRPEEAVEYQADKIQLMTLHASKGLEFPVVFIAGCEDGLMPWNRNGGVNIEEERRLFYVGMTRAKEELFLTLARKRLMYGQIRFSDVSPFLKDIQDDLKRLETAEARKPRKIKPDSGQMSLFN